MNDIVLTEVDILASTPSFRRGFLHGEAAALSSKENVLSTEERCITFMRYLFVDMAAQGNMTDQMLRLNTGYLLGFLNKLALEPYGSRTY